MRINSWFVAVAFLAVPAAAFAQQDSHKPVPTSAAVDFGVLPTAPLGPLPCLQSGAIGGPADPCSYKLHHLTPEEVTLKQGGEVTFQIHGGGHGFAIYEVSKDTTREEVGQYLCAGEDPQDIPNPALHVCNLSPVNADAEHTVRDGQNKVVRIIVRETLEEISTFGDGGRQPGQFYAVHSIATDSKGNVYTTETYRGQRLQKFVYKGLAAVTKPNQGTVWPTRTSTH